jgi:anaerobic magnesium-protoporphyrin IX monomethyl ester cyclase
MNLLLVRPPVIHRRGDFFGSIPGIPIGLAHLAAVVRAAGHRVQILDCYGADPHRLYPFRSDYLARGLTPEEACSAVPSGTEALGLSIHCATEQAVAEPMIGAFKTRYPELPLIVGGYHPTFVPEEFVRMGADYVVLGAGERRLPTLLEVIEKRRSLDDLDGIAHPGGTTQRVHYLEQLDGYPLPAVDLLPLENYWELRYGHGPVRGPYMNVITSRGCPYKCGFCQAPLMSGGRWLARSPADVMRELTYYHNTWDITDFTLNRKRAIEFCEHVIALDKGFTFCLPSGINAMSVDEPLVSLMAESGFRYLSVSPESGSTRVLELMGKRMDLQHLRSVVQWASDAGVRTNACFMLGYPGEAKEDRRSTKRYVGTLARAGVDEVIIPIMTPFPGTPSMESFPGRRSEELCFSPRWRDDYDELSRYRTGIYTVFLGKRLMHKPLGLFQQVFNVLRRRHGTKGEMTITRIIRDSYDWHIRRRLKRLTGRNGRVASITFGS